MIVAVKHGGCSIIGLMSLVVSQDYASSSLVGRPSEDWSNGKTTASKPVDVGSIPTFSALDGYGPNKDESRKHLEIGKGLHGTYLLVAI